MSLDTGNNRALNGRLLKKVNQMLDKDYGHRTVRALKDRVGTYAFIKRDHYGGRYILIAKGSELFWSRDYKIYVVSTQCYLPQQAARENTPIIFVWQNPETEVIKYYLFDPWEIVEKYGDRRYVNPRYGVDMRNWDFKLGISYHPSKDVSGLYQKVKKKRQGLLAFST